MHRTCNLSVLRNFESKLTKLELARDNAPDETERERLQRGVTRQSEAIEEYKREGRKSLFG